MPRSEYRLKMCAVILLLQFTDFETVVHTTDFREGSCWQCGADRGLIFARGHIRVDCCLVTLIYRVVKMLFLQSLRLISSKTGSDCKLAAFG